MRKGLNFLIVTILIAPFMALLVQAGSWSFPFTAETGSIFLFTVWQAFLSAALSLALGIAGGYGLLALRSGRSPALAQGVQALVLVPNVVPVLLVILAALNLFAVRGLGGIVFVHALLNAGLLAVAFARLVTDRLGGLAEQAWVESASRFRFFRTAVLGGLRSEIGLLFLFVFALCFASFAVPLLVGGSRATTIEVLIYEKIRLTTDWSNALGLAALQTVFLVAVSFVIGRPGAVKSGRHTRLPILEWKWGLGAVLLPVAIVLVGLVRDLPIGMSRLLEIPNLTQQIPELALASALVGLGTGLLTIGFLLLITAARPEGTVRRLLVSYVAPSSVILGFALILLWRATGFASLVKIMIGITLISVPAFVRLDWMSRLASLEGQTAVARILGAGDGLIFWRILLPQVWSPACLLGGIAAFWAWGDFALSAVIAERTLTLALLVQSLMGAYRLEAATALVWLLLIGGGVTFLLFAAAGRLAGISNESAGSKEP